MINDRDRFTQKIDFWWIPASDIDMCIEVDNEFLFLFEFKVKWVDVPYWQHLMLSRISKSRHNKSFIFYCSHTTKANEVIVLDNCIINTIWFKNKKREWEWKIRDTLKKIAKHYKNKKLYNLM